MQIISIAPMLDVTDRHFRMFMRCLTRRAMLYTEMKTCAAILHGDGDALLGFDAREMPLALQLGGANPLELAECAKLAKRAGFTEVNLNVGCPSSRVRDGDFGACLMAKPEVVVRAVAAMRAAVDLPITVKTRIGIDDLDSYEYLAGFVKQVARVGCEHFIIHARCAWLQGLSPKENRNLPPLNYSRVYKLAKEFPQLKFTINGGIQDLNEVRDHLQFVDGAMLGRAAVQDPWLLREVDEIFYSNNNPAIPTRAQVVSEYLNYVEQQLSNGVMLKYMTKPLLGLFHSQPHARSWRRYLCQHSTEKNAGSEVILNALRLMQDQLNFAARPDNNYNRATCRQNTAAVL